MNKVLLTGANGFIGRYCVNAFLDAGFDVYAACHSDMAGLPQNAHCFLWDIKNTQEVIKLMSAIRPSHLVHLAWYVEPDTYVHADENIDWLQYSMFLIKAFVQSGGKRLVTVGTCFEYDLNHSVFQENSTPLMSNSLYATAKTSLFRLSSVYCHNHGVEYAHARPFYLFGIGENEKRVIPHIISSLLQRQQVQVSHGEQVRDYLYVADVASALAAVSASEISGAVNIGSGIGVQLKELFLMIERATGCTGLVQLGAIPTKPNEAPVIIADNRRLLCETNWRQKYSLEAGLQETIAAMQ